jgi:O-antigen ligase
MSLLQGVTGGSFAVVKGQQLSHVERVSGFGGDPNGYAAQIVVGCVWMLQFFISQRKIVWRIIFAATLSVLMLAVILSYSRGGAITLAFALMLYALLHIKTIGAGRLAGVAIIGIIAAFLFIPHTYWERLSSLTEFTTDFSMWRRLSYHLMAPDMLMMSPIVGVGPANFSWHYMSTDFRFITDVFHGPHRLHNMYLSILVELGIVGFFFFMGLILKTLFNFVQLIQRNVTAEWMGTIYPIGSPLLIGSLAYLLSNLFLPGEFSKLLWGLLAIGGSSEAIIRNQREAPPPKTVETTDSVGISCCKS